MTTTSSSRRAKSASVGKSRATDSASAQPADSLTGSPDVQTHLERAREIGKLVIDAMAKSNVDWKQESPLIAEAQADLEEQMALYRENQASREEVRASYHRFRDAHSGGLF